MSTGLPVEVHGLILDLERRIRLLESGLYGHAAPECDVAVLMRCYLDAHGVAKSPDTAAVHASAWVAQAWLWDVRALVTLGRQVSDPYPFRPLLACLDACVRAEVPGAVKARDHLESVSRDLLRAQGLELIEPRDTMGSLRLEEALRRVGLTGQR